MSEAEAIEAKDTGVATAGLVAMLLLVLSLIGTALVLEVRAAGYGGDVEVDLQRSLADVELRRVGEGLVVVDSVGRQVPGSEWLEAVAAAQESQRGAGAFYVLFNITGPVGFLWVSIGFLGQAAFTFRMLLQWWASERAGCSVVPLGFWYGSLAGGLLLLVYFVWRKDLVGVSGQATGVLVYTRNLMLARAGR